MSSSSTSRLAPDKSQAARSTSASRSWPRFALPSPASPEFTPALATGALVLLIVLQIALPDRTDLPPDFGLAPRHARAPIASPIPAYPALSAQNVFSLDRQTGAAAEGAGLAVDQFRAVGVIAAGKAVSALLKAPGAPARLVRVGQSLAGWRLTAITRDGVVLQQGQERRRLRVDATPEAAVPPSLTSPAPQTAESTQ
jgi:hypothetical protein